MSTETPTAPAPAAKKPDVVALPTAMLLVSCVLMAMGNSRQSALLLWQLPLALIGFSVLFVGWRRLRARG
jgi:hypothetical protein